MVCLVGVLLLGTGQERKGPVEEEEEVTEKLSSDVEEVVSSLTFLLIGEIWAKTSS